MTLTTATPHDHNSLGSTATRLGFPEGTGFALRRFFGATIACLAALLMAAPAAFANSDIEVVAGNTNTNVSAGPNFTATAASAQVGADNINGFLAAGTDVTLDTTSAHAGTGTITVNAGITSANVNGDLTLNADDVISQTASITVAGNTHVETTVNDNITLTQATNDFSTVSSPDVATLSLRDQNALQLGSIDTNSNLDITAAGNVTQTAGAVLNTNHVTLTIGSNDVTLTNAGNDFDGFIANSVGDATFSNSATSGFQLRGTVSGDLAVTTGGNIFDAEPISVVGTATLDPNGSITLDNPADDFSTVAVAGASNVTLVDTNALAFGASTVSGALTATASGAVTQTGPLVVTGPSVLGAGSANDITLTNASNNFSSAGIGSADGVSLTDASTLELTASSISGDLTAAANGALTQSGALAVGGATAASGSPVTLDQASNDFTGAVGITSSGGGAATVDDTNDLILASSTSGGSLTATADGDLTMPGSAAIAATGALRLVADDANPAAPAIGDGGVTAGANAALTGAGAIRLYGSRRGDNSIAGTATFNGSTFTPGTIFVNSAREQWGVYSPAGTATAPFTFFYKDTDTSTPQATITSPVNGATYERGQVVNAEYSCSDGGGGSGVATCSGTAPNGSPIDTSTTGEKTFEVAVVSGSGGQSTSRATYTVVDTPPDRKCGKLRKKLKRQKGGLKRAGSDAKRSRIEKNIADTKERLRKLNC